MEIRKKISRVTRQNKWTQSDIDKVVENDCFLDAQISFNTEYMKKEVCERDHEIF